MLWCFLLMNFWPLIARTTFAKIIGPDTISVNNDTFYQYGHDSLSKASIKKTWAYRHLTPAALEALARLEWNIYHEISNIYVELSDTISAGDKFATSVKQYLEDFEGTSLQLVNRMINESNNTSIEYILTTNPLTPFLTVRRFRNYIRPWSEKTGKASDKTDLQDAVLRHILSVYKRKDGPFRMDFHFSMLAIIMPHFILDLKAENIANGLFRQKKIQVNLKACHCLDIGVHGIATGMYPVGIEWIELTLSKIENGDDSADLEFATKWLEIGILKHDEKWKAGPLEYSSVASQFYEKPLKNMKTGEDRKWQKQKICEDKENLPNVLSKTNRLPVHLHWSICKGDVEQTSSEKSKLFCWYEKELNAIFRIGPLKVELLSAFPRLELVQFHNLVSNNSFLNAIKSDVAHRFKATVTEDGIPVPKFNYAVLTELKSPELLQKFELLAKRVTGLRGLSSHAQVATYVPGGFSCTHEDWRDFGDVKAVNRAAFIATFMLYLEQPKQGGETSFPLSLVKSTPVKGSAILSYNLLRSGVKDKYAPHASCPMTLGRKWVAINDFIYTDQSHLTCSKHRDDRHEILVNGKSKYRNKFRQKL